MTREVVSVAPDVELQSVVKTILEHRIHRVLVLDEKADGGNLAGIITLFDLVRLLE
jgi:CBS domain-containing protein